MEESARQMEDYLRIISSTTSGCPSIRAFQHVTNCVILCASNRPSNHAQTARFNQHLLLGPGVASVGTELANLQSLITTWAWAIPEGGKNGVGIFW